MTLGSLIHWHTIMPVISGEINKSGINTNVTGNHVENVPDWINKTGITLQHKNISTSFQFCYTSRVYNDAFNTIASSDGITGVIPAYSVWDWAASFRFYKQLQFSAGINNFTNNHYFNRRITMYPGPGILPADGRTFYVTLGLKI